MLTDIYSIHTTLQSWYRTQSATGHSLQSCTYAQVRATVSVFAVCVCVCVCRGAYSNALMLSSGQRLKKPYTTVDWDTSGGIFINCCEQDTKYRVIQLLAQLHSQSLFPFPLSSHSPNESQNGNRDWV